MTAYRETAERLKALIAAWTADALTAKVTTEHGETDRGERCRSITLHLWYHSGQLNFIQTLLGDAGWPWS